MTEPAVVAAEVADALIGGDFAGATKRFGGMLAQALAPEQLESAWGSAIAEFGNVKGRGEPSAKEIMGRAAGVVTIAFEREEAELIVALDHDAIVGLNIRPKRPPVEHPPPRYADGAAFEERSLTVGSGELALPGTLAMPAKKKLFRKGAVVPGIVCVHGSGPNDRDETVGGNKVFLDIALGLASRGIAVLRYEKRTRAHPDKVTPDIGVEEEVLDDALTAVTRLGAVDGVGPVFVLGHSLGGTLAPAIGARDPSIAGLVVLAGATRPLGAMVLEQTRHIMTAAGAVDEGALATLAAQAEIADGAHLTPKTPSSSLPLGIPASYLLSLRAHYPQLHVEGARQPMLVLQGERDYQVTMEDFAGWKTMLGARAHVTFKSYPDLNHCFAPGKGVSRPQEYAEPANVAEQVIKDIAAWIAALG